MQMKTGFAAAILLSLAVSAISAQNSNAGDVKAYVRGRDVVVRLAAFVWASSQM
jgi:hypothetical protein